MLHDPVCGKRIHRNRAHAHIEYQHVTYYLCCPRCQAEFEAGPQQFARPEFGERASRTANRIPDQQRVRR
jgi:YHS domain-containing protein